MIWHFAEVWALLAVSFVIGCLLGGYSYGVIARSGLASMQGAVADQIGDVVDRIKASLGMSADWRPQHTRVVERQLPPRETRASEASDIDDAELDDLALPPPAEREEPRFAEAVPLPALERPRHAAPAAEDDPPDMPAIEEPDRLASTGAVADDGIVPMRPAGLSGPRAGVPDNLTRIRGVGERNEARLNRLGIYHFGQIAAWTPGEVRWIGQYLAFPERIERDDWVGQAMILASGGDTGFEKSADRRRRRRRERNQSVAAQQLAADVESIMGRRRSTPQSDADDANESDDD
jgi:predicted flap endonuclease-1-like 5' DNA nuclease